MPAAASPGASPRRKIAYIKRGLFSYSNVRTGEQLRKRFPGYEVEEIDVVADILRENEGAVAMNCAHIARIYWRDLLARRQSFRLAFYRTPYIFGKIRDLVRQRLAGREHEFVFSLQTQSLYDASIPGIPHFVYTDHTHLTNLGYPGFPAEQLYARQWIDLEREIYTHAERTFVMSEHVRRSLIEQYAIAPSRVATVFAGSNVDPSPVALQNDNYGNRTVVFVGIDFERKGGPALLAAFGRVLERLPDARLVIVGASPRVSSPQIEVLGKVPRDEVKRQLTRASVLCLPTRVEPFGIAVIEAFYHCLPVVASNIGAMPDLVHDGETGRIVPPDDPAALAAALIELLSDPAKARRYGERGREIVGEHFSWDAAGEKIHDGILAALAAR